MSGTITVQRQDQYNNAVTTFPGSIFAGSLGKSRKGMLEIPPADREVPKVSFGA